MKRWILAALVLMIAAPLAFADAAFDDFETGHTLGETPLDWSTKWATNPPPPLQQNLMTVEDGVGVGGSRGLKVHIDQTRNEYRTVNPVPIHGSNITVQADFQIATLGGTNLNVEPSGVNKGLIGVELRGGTNWNDNGAVSFNFARRQAQGNNWGINMPTGPAWIDGWNDNGAIGLAGGLTPSTSDWFTIAMNIAVGPAGTNWVASYEVTSGGQPVASGGPFAVPTNHLASGTSPLYGVITVPYANPVVTNSVAERSKVTMVNVDNFAIGTGPAVLATDVAMGITGYEFTSVAGRTHRLQYSLDGVIFLDTGSSVEGDGTDMVLIDTAADTAGRTYRVTSE